MGSSDWYPQNPEKLKEFLNKFVAKPKNIHGLIVPHAGYIYSGEIAGNAFSLLPKKEKAIILAPSHYTYLKGIASIEKIKTPLGEIKITENSHPKLDYEHAVENQFPFLQKLGYKEVLPLVVGEINENDAKKIAEQISKIDAVYIFSTDLSHFLSYEKAVEKDKKTIEIIKNLKIEKWKEIDACGKFPLLILMHLCKQQNWKPKLIEYKNSGDITQDKTRVVGYSSFYF